MLMLDLQRGTFLHDYDRLVARINYIIFSVDIMLFNILFHSTVTTIKLGRLVQVFVDRMKSEDNFDVLTIEFSVRYTYLTYRNLTILVEI